VDTKIPSDLICCHIIQNLIFGTISCPLRDPRHHPHLAVPRVGPTTPHNPLIHRPSLNHAWPNLKKVMHAPALPKEKSRPCLSTSSPLLSTHRAVAPQKRRRPPCLRARRRLPQPLRFPRALAGTWNGSEPVCRLPTSGDRRFLKRLRTARRPQAPETSSSRSTASPPQAHAGNSKRLRMVVEETPMFFMAAPLRSSKADRLPCHRVARLAVQAAPPDCLATHSGTGARDSLIWLSNCLILCTQFDSVPCNPCVRWIAGIARDPYAN
jgi:hypothetical protein